MDTKDDKYCIIGAGPSGLAAAKNFAQFQIPFDCLEREDDVGGTWFYGKPASGVCHSTHLISSKRLTEFADFPMPPEWPEYPSHHLAHQYFRDYAQHFDLRQRIEFNSAVERIDPAADFRTWTVTLRGGVVRRYRGIVIANGHNWDPRRPDYPGQFAGLTLHSAAYKTPEILAGKRVLVVGAGNSGCDIAVEAAQHAARTFHSTRRGYYYLPKFLLGRPADRCGEFLLRLRIPLWLRRMISVGLVKLASGWPQDYGLAKPDHRFLESHPIVNSQMMYYVGHGDIVPKPDVVQFAGQQVRFADGSCESVDIIVYATGYNISFPFLDRQHLNWIDRRPELFLNIFHPRHDNLFVAGLIQPDSGQWGLVDLQSQLIVRFIRAVEDSPELAEKFRRLKGSSQPDLGGGIRYLNSTRHLLEVEHFSYRRRLKKLIAQMSSKQRRGDGLLAGMQ